MQKLFSKICLAIGVTGLISCSLGKSDESYASNGQNSAMLQFDDEFNGQEMSSAEARFYATDPNSAASVFNKRVPPLNSLIVCRDKQCAPAELSKSKEYIFNALAQLVDNNLDKTALLCEANAQTHVCTNPYLTVPAKVGVTPAYVFFDGVKIIDAAISNGKTAFNLVLGYNLSYNGQTPTICKPDKAMLYVKDNNGVVLNGNGFKCDMTSIGTTMIRILFNIDYVDLDYGYIGGYYSIGLSGPAYGGGSGYGLIRLPEDAHPLNPALQAPKQDEDEYDVQPQPLQASVKPNINSTALSLVDDDAAKAVAPVEVKVADEEKKDPVVLERQPLQHINFETSEENDYVNSAQPYQDVSDKPTVVVTDGGIIVGENGPVSSSRDENFGPTFEEVYVEDLDEYIK